MIKNEKVIIRYIPDYRNYDVKHILKGGMHRDGKKLLTLRRQNGSVMPTLPNGEPFLTSKDIEELKEQLGNTVDFSLGSSFWKDNDNFHLVLVNGDIVLDLTNIYDCIKLKVAQQYDMVIAPTWKEKDKLPTYGWAIIREGEDVNANMNELSYKKRAYKAYGKYEDSRRVLTYIYYKLEDKLISPTTKLNIVQGWFNDLIDRKVELFVKYIEDPLLYEKSLVFEGWQENIIHKEGDLFIYSNNENSYKLSVNGEGNIDDAAEFLSSVKNQQIKLEIEGRINNKNSK